MKNLYYGILFILTLVGGTSHHQKPKPIHKPHTVLVKKKIHYRGSFRQYLDSLSKFESNNVLDTINRFGYMGKYQFSMRTIKSLGFHITKRQFLYNPELQDSVMIHNLLLNHKILNSLMKRYSGKRFKGIMITRSGMLAGAHLVGAGGVMAFFNDKLPYSTSDGNGTLVSYYIEKFGGYSLEELYAIRDNHSYAIAGNYSCTKCNNK